MNQALESVRWTVHDLEVLPQSEGVRYEIIDGELFVTRSPHRKHQQICVKIASLLNAWSEATGLGETIFAPGIIFSDADNVCPDVVWVSKERLALIEDEAGHLTGAPELVIEVLSPGKDNERRDKEAKLKLYSVTGVLEYWIVDRFKQQVEIYRRDRAILTLIFTLYHDDEITSTLLPDFRCSVARFFAV
ncbi:protein of unknown function DUF820 [Gloeothece citriformis PCC 7424]|uniref:Putative restriction endonuclease domain-containing protein n=1 Tax=Gloeothece citriformis (strain PCC 7424) TaxID=65393 RepID=B7KGN6_GLOC7|nr:Uma2 family endonuclease [Gloeothece citriformis]ACK71963.1 protein of unknown function DUF820 [Gloeothece citriformis PCC 7424]